MTAVGRGPDTCSNLLASSPAGPCPGRLARRAVPEPHWYLRLLGVDPAHGLGRADAEGRPCFLETFAERTVPFHLGDGFELVVEDVEPTSGIRYQGFSRAPAG